MLRLSPVFIGVALVLGLAACTTTAQPSGFLTSYENFRPGPKGGGWTGFGRIRIFAPRRTFGRK